VNTIDISLLGRYILEIIDGFSVPLEAADVNGDGDINTQDHTLMTRYLMELITEFPVERNR
ncbi:MAG TPA: dockerin type I repeat-containing protein, partial [Acetivibrio saccincola]|nr:dockerin type I repeat-containing protein [Acetivibrio saccincola]